MRRLFCCLALSLALPAIADSYTWGDSRFNTGFDEEQKPWEEIKAQLPATPKAENLLPFEVSAASTNRYFIDSASLSVGVDQVVRYTVLIRSQAGAETVNFEGMRCSTGERKIYAFGRSGEWVQNRHARWERATLNVQSSYHRELYFSYFCAESGNLAPLDTIIRRFKTGGYRN